MPSATTNGSVGSATKGFVSNGFGANGSGTNGAGTNGSGMSGSDSARALDKGVGLTDANMTVANDWPNPITSVVDNNYDMGTTFPSPVTIGAGQTISHEVEASTWSLSQSYFDVEFGAAGTIHTLIGTGHFSTSATPAFLPSGQGGAVLAPGTPFSTATDFAFWFFHGPGKAQDWFNSFIQANLPAIINYIASHPITIPVNDSVSITISNLQMNPGSLTCGYAAAIPPSDPSSTIRAFNAILNVGQGTIVGSASIKGHTGDLNLSVSNNSIWVQFQVDLSGQQKPQVTKLQTSLDDYTLSGTIIDVLKSAFPLVAKLFAYGLATPYHLAGFLDNNANQTIIDAINSAIGNLFKMPLHSAPGDTLKSIIPLHGLPKLSRRAPGTDQSTWMSNAQIQARTLAQLKLPGTHDSATYDLSTVLSQITYPDIEFLWNLSAQAAPVNGKWPVVFPPTSTQPLYLGQDLYNFVLGQAVNSISRSQGFNITQQLAAGIRWFDLRVYYDNRDNTFYTQHALRGPAVRDLLSQIQAFLTANSSSGELIFLQVGHTNFDKYPEQIPNFINLIKAIIPGNNIYYPPGASAKPFDFQSLANTTVGSMTNGSPKVMFLNDDNISYPDTVTNSTGYASRGFSGERYTVDELIAQEGDALKTHTEPLWSLGWALGADNTAIAANIFTLLTGVESWALQTLATEANRALSGFVNQNGGASARFNVVSVDWLQYGSTPSVPDFIIGLNA